VSVAFFRTVHELESDSPRGSILTIALATAVLGLWAGWLSLARISVYRSTDRARLIGGTGYEADASVAGRVVSIRFRLGQKVNAGDPLVMLDQVAEQRQLDEDRTRESVIEPELSEISREIAAENDGLQAARRTAAIALDQARVQWQGAEKAWRIADDISMRYRTAKAVVPQIELLRADAEAQAARAKADGLRLELARLGQDSQAQQSDRTAHIEQLKEDGRHLEGEKETTAAEIKRLEYEIEKRLIRAPITGRIAGIAPIRVGAFVHEGDRLATVIPAETIKAIAEFAPSTSLGLIKPGQRAWVHLNGFPWTQYGSIHATVASVASEPTLVNSAGEAQDERIRVELRIDPRSAPLIPIQYGLPGTAEIEVERISPARLIMRAAGQTMTKPVASN
jgi:membrane fusion protein (multidrug efflux system)